MESVVNDRAEIDLAEVLTLDAHLVGGSLDVLVGPGTPRLVIENVQVAPVTVVWEDGHLHIEQRVQGAGGVQVKGLLLGAVVGFRGPKADVSLVVPAAIAARIQTVSAEVVIAAGGPTAIKTISGNVTASRIDSSFRVDTVSGEVEATGVTGEVAVKTVSGDVTVAGGACPALKAHSVSGDLTFDLDLADGPHRVQSVSGDVALRVHQRGCEVRATTASGSLNCAGASASRPGLRRMHTVVGAGQAKVDVQTVSGDVDVVQAPVLV